MRFLRYIVYMVTTTIHNGWLAELGCKRTKTRNVAGYTVEIVAALNGLDGYVIDILVGLKGQKVSTETLAEINNEIERSQNEILAIFGY